MQVAANGLAGIAESLLQRWDGRLSLSVYVLRSQGRTGPTLRIPILRSAKAAPLK